MTGVIDMLRERFGIEVRHARDGNHKLTCPKCSHTRKNKRDPCLSVTITGRQAVFFCHNCQFTGGVDADRTGDQMAGKPGDKRGQRPRRRAGSRIGSHW
jgi:hypothetical protein